MTLWYRLQKLTCCAKLKFKFGPFLCVPHWVQFEDFWFYVPWKTRAKFLITLLLKYTWYQVCVSVPWKTLSYVVTQNLQVLKCCRVLHVFEFECKWMAFAGVRIKNGVRHNTYHFRDPDTGAIQTPSKTKYNKITFRKFVQKSLPTCLFLILTFLQ